jgi:hypothetical protein
MFQFMKKVAPEAKLTILADEQLTQATGGCSNAKHASSSKKKWAPKKHHHHHHQHKHKYWDSKKKCWCWD